MIQPFSSIEIAVKEIIEQKYAAANGHVGGDLSYGGEPLYVMLSLVPGAGSTNPIEGSWVMDIDVFSPNYGQAILHALMLEAILLDAPHRSQDMIIDTVYQNSSPAEAPWDDESSARVGATYVFSARRRD